MDCAANFEAEAAGTRMIWKKRALPNEALSLLLCKKRLALSLFGEGKSLSFRACLMIRPVST
jgi:hypothetical protein